MILLVIVCMFLYLNLDAVQLQVNNAYNFISETFGWFFIVVDTLCLLLAIYFIFGRYRNVKLGSTKCETTILHVLMGSNDIYFQLWSMATCIRFP